MGLRVSETIRIGPFRIRLSAPVGKGRARVTAGTRIGKHGRVSISEPIGGKRRKR